MPDAQYWREMDKATRYPPKDRKRMEADALKALNKREKPASTVAKTKKPSGLSSALGTLGTVAKAAKGISKDMGQAIAYEVNTPPKLHITTKKPKRRTVTKPKPRAATKPPVFAIKPAWM